MTAPLQRHRSAALFLWKLRLQVAENIFKFVHVIVSRITFDRGCYFLYLLLSLYLLCSSICFSLWAFSKQNALLHPNSLYFCPVKFHNSALCHWCFRCCVCDTGASKLIFSINIWASMHLCMYSCNFCDYLQSWRLRSVHSTNLFEWLICLLANESQEPRVGVRVTGHGFQFLSFFLSFLHIILQLEGIPPGLYCSHFASNLFNLCNLQIVCSAFPWQFLSCPLNQLSICFHLHLAELSPIFWCDLVAAISDIHGFKKNLLV